MVGKATHGMARKARRSGPDLSLVRCRFRFVLVRLLIRPAALGPLLLERLLHRVLPVAVDLQAFWIWAGLGAALRVVLAHDAILPNCVTTGTAINSTSYPHPNITNIYPAHSDQMATMPTGYIS